jgi:SAM-dependent methyltransferase
LRPVVVRQLAANVSLRSRERKFRLFMDELRPGPETTVVDVGVTDSGFGEHDGHGATHNFFEALYPWPERVTAVSDTPLGRFAEAFPRVRCVTADGRRLPFADGEFDLGFSNAVVEHVGGRDDQRAFVHELCRVARRVFVTTPNRWFPLEVHTLLPLVHWLPRERRDRAFAALGKGDARELELLGPAELRALFPYPVRIVNSGLTLTAIGP